MENARLLLSLFGPLALLQLGQSVMRTEGRQAGTGQPAALAAANELFAAPWAGLSDQYERDSVEGMERSLEGRRIAHGSGEVKELGLEWRATLGIEDVNAHIDLSSPPAFREASLRRFVLDLPRDAWSFGVSGRVKGNVWVKELDQKIFTWSPSVPFGLRFEEFRISTRVDLDDSVPSRPTLVRASVTPHVTVGGHGAIPVSVPVSFQASVEGGKLSLGGRITSLDLDLDPLDAKLTTDVTITFLPKSQSLDLELGEVVDLHVQTQEIEVALNGKLSVRLDKVGRKDLPFELSWRAQVPSSREIEQVLALLHLQQPLPRPWGENRPLGRAPAPAVGVDFAQPAAEIENAVLAHLPWGGILTTVQPPASPARGVAFGGVGGLDLRSAPPSGPAWTGEEDSAIWTGHYLAAEAFRFAATDSPEALERVKQSLAGIELLFRVASDVAVVKTPDFSKASRGLEGRERVAVTAGPGILARVAMPANASIQPKHGPLSERDLYYEAPEGGWEVSGTKKEPARRYARYGDIPELDRTRFPERIKPLGNVWHGWGLGDDHPVSRDQYSGIFLGLAFAHELVDDPDVRARSRRLIEEALDYLLRNGWNVVLPPHNRICTTFLGNIEKQLAFLRIGASVAPEKYGERYRRVADAASLTWIALWLSSLDPLFQYYKFNLVHAVIAPTLYLERDPALRAGYKVGYDMLWRTVGHHRNAWFDLVHILVELPEQRAAAAWAPAGSNPAIPLAGEIRTTLAEWLERRRLVPGPNGLPRYAVADPAYQASLWPHEVARFPSLDGTRRYVSRSALPVTARNGQGMDFAWQRHPFTVGLDESRDPAQPPTHAEIETEGAPGSHPRCEGPGVDYLLAYWLALYLDVLSGDAGSTVGGSLSAQVSEMIARLDALEARLLALEAKAVAAQRPGR
jgi:hypothetical protein